MMRHLVLCLSVFVTVASAQKLDRQVIYKWVEDGSTKYGYYVPAGIEDYEEFNKKEVSHTVTDMDREESLAVDQGLNASTEENDEEMDIRAKNCQISRTNLSSLTSGSVFEKKEDGTIVELTDEEKQARIPQVEKDVEYFCSE